MPEFLTAADIGNRAAQHCGAEMMDQTLGFTEDSKVATQISFVYGKLRRAELDRNIWTFATRRAALRPIDTTTMLLTPTVWASTTTYYRGSIVDDGSGTLWISRTQGNSNNQPQNSATWEPYFGPMAVSPYDTTIAYRAGELVYTAAGDGTYRVYLSLMDGNSDNPATATTWGATTTYNTAQVVTYLSVVYQSLVDLNLNQAPNVSPAAWTTSFVGGAGDIQWLEIGGAEFPAGVGLTTLNILYPIGAGPSSQSTSKNVFLLPAGYLRRAPEDPKLGAFSALGAPANMLADDWEIENGYLITRVSTIIFLRFIADMQDVTKMEDLFCEMLAASIAEAVCEPLTNSTAKLASIRQTYKDKKTDAMAIDAIEVGGVESPLDDWIACRV